MLDEVDILSWLDDAEPAHSAIPVKSAKSSSLTSTQTAGTCFEIQREVLLSLLEKVISVVPTRDIIPVMTNLQFIVGVDSVEIVATATDMSISVRTEQVDVKVPGVEVFPARTFASVIKETEAGSTIYIEATVHGLVIVANTYAVEIAMSSGRGFPKLENTSQLSFYSVARKSFIEAITKVKYALPGKEYSGQDSLRMVSIKNGKFTACDGARFQQVRMSKFDLNMQLPADKINQLLKVLSQTDIELIEISEVKEKLVFKVSNVLFFINKLSDPYPNVEQLWLRPALTNDQELLVNKQQLITAIKQVKVLADPHAPAIGLILDSESMKIIAKKDDSNSASTTIACKWAGKPRNVVVNYTHLAEMLRAYDSDECRFLLGDDTQTYKAPILLKEEDAMATVAQMMAYRAGL